MTLSGRLAVGALRLWGPGGERAWARRPRFVPEAAAGRGLAAAGAEKGRHRGGCQNQIGRTFGARRARQPGCLASWARLRESLEPSGRFARLKGTPQATGHTTVPLGTPPVCRSLLVRTWLLA